MPLPDFLLDKYKDWKENYFKKKENLYKILEEKGQNPKAMIISCCDSRVDANSIFNAYPGDFFYHRNIANIIPPYSYDKFSNSEIISSIEYGILSLKISSIIIMGHSSCGGIKYAHEKFSKDVFEKERNSLNQWIDNVKSAYNIIDKNQSELNCIKALEKQSIINSIENLKNYPDIKKLVLEKKLTIHGLYFEINSGRLNQYNEITKKFEILSY